MVKKGFNWRARRVVESKIDNTETKKIQLDIKSAYNGYDQCNELVIPSKKRNTKLKHECIRVTNILSKTQRKRLEKIIDKKKKKENRSALLEALAAVQAPQSELDQLTSIAEVQTKGLKNIKKLTTSKTTFIKDKSNASTEISSTTGSRKRKQILSEMITKKKCLNHSRNDIVESESSDYATSDSESELQKNEDEKSYKVSDSESDLEKNKDKSSYKVSTADSLYDHSPKDLDLPAEKKNGQDLAIRQMTDIHKSPAVYIELDRDPEINAARLKLPILGEEQVIMECIKENQIIILAGETGSGKTTQVPQFLYEAGYAQEKMIGITEPRRVAALSMSERVAKEMNLSCREVSYLIRFEGNTTPDTKIKFMTDGVLLKEIQSDFALNKYSVIILDEAHERSVYTDILIGLLSRIVPYRNKHSNSLKLIIMSATLRIEDFTKNSRLFKIPPPVINIESRQFPVSVHFSKQTPQNYIFEAFRKSVKIHTTLPDGGILIFLTGQQEVKALVKKLRKAFPYKNIKNVTSEPDFGQSEGNENGMKNEAIEWSMKKSIRAIKKTNNLKKSHLPEVNLDDYDIMNEDIDPNLADDDDQENDEEYMSIVGLSNTQPLWVLPMYSLLPSHKQAKVFQKPPEGTRLCVVSTNVAETSLTIPNIKYVIDCGRQKTRIYDKITGVSSFVVTYCSKAAANQRAGRAGRTAPGHCYRLYSSAVYNDEFKDYAKPEIQCRPVDDLILQMKSMGIDKVVNFPFPSAPDLLQLRYAETRLKLLGALDSTTNRNSKVEFAAKISELGKAISAFPVAPRFGKMLALSHQQSLLPYTICMVAGLSVQEVFVEVPLDNIKDKKSKWSATRRLWAGVGNSFLMGDPMVLLRAIGAAEFAGSLNTLEHFCIQNGLRPKAIIEIRKLRTQMTNDINLNIPELNLFIDPRMSPPTDIQAKLLRQILLSGLGDQVAQKIKENEIKENEDKRKYKYAYHCCEMEEPVFIHSCSVLRKKAPEWVVYQDVYETKTSEGSKIFIRGITAIEPEWLPKYVPMLCNFGEPLTDPEPRYCSINDRLYCHVNATFGKAAWELPVIEVEFPNTLDSYKWFAKFFLEGLVFGGLCKYRNILLSKPDTMIKSWARLLPRTDAILKTLAAKLINTKAKLLEAWKTDPNYLLAAYQMWLPESSHSEITLIWSSLNNCS